MTYTTILNELLDSGDKFKAVPKGKYDAEHAPYTFYINKSISGLNIYFSLSTTVGVKNYVFMYKNVKSGGEIHFSIQNESGSYSNDLTGLNNAPEVLSAVIYFSKIALKMYYPQRINIMCKDSDASRKRVYMLLANKIGSEYGYKINNISSDEDHYPEAMQIIELVKNDE